MDHPARHPAFAHRRGTVLPIVLGVLGLIAVMVAAGIDRAVGAHRLQDSALARTQALMAAEGAAALKETVLVNLAATNDLQRLETLSPNCGTQWFANAAVRWRIEPVLLREVSGGARWSVNPPANVSMYPRLQALDPTQYKINYDYYNFRIVTEAFVHPDYTAASTPWDPDSASARRAPPLASVQVQHVVQLKLNSLFKYAIFYAAEGHDGDLELFPGPQLKIAGAVHSNGAIYLGGGGSSGGSGGGTASFLDGNGVLIGGTGSGLGRPTSIVGIDGIYRMLKVNNQLQLSTPTVPVPDPMLIQPASSAGSNGQLVASYNPTVTAPFVTAGGNFNSRMTTGSVDDKFQINDVPMTAANDSRSPANLKASFGTYVSDGVTLGATVVRTLSNIPHLAGRPFEHQALVPTGTPVYSTGSPAALDHIDPTLWSIRSPAAADDARLYWSVANPTSASQMRTRRWLLATYGVASLDQISYGGAGTIVAGSGGTRIAAVDGGGLPQFIQDLDGSHDPGSIPNRQGARDLQPPTADTDSAGFSIWADPGAYRNDALVGAGDGSVGMIIRERPAQQLTIWPGAGSAGPGDIRYDLFTDDRIRLDSAAVADGCWAAGVASPTRTAINAANGAFFLVAEANIPGNAVHPSAAFPRPDPNWLVYTGEPGVFLESGGNLYLPAEGYSQVLSSPRSGDTPLVAWRPFSVVQGSTAAKLPTTWSTGTGAGGGLPADTNPSTARYAPAMGAWPDRFRSWKTAALKASAPRLSYRVRFATPGTYTVWVRGRALHSTSRELHLGLTAPGAAPDWNITWPTGLSATPLRLTVSSDWTWVCKRSDGAVAQVTVGAAGTYVLHLFAADDGVVVDGVFLTQTVGGSQPPSTASTTAQPTIAHSAQDPATHIPPLRRFESDMVLYLKSQYTAAIGGAALDGGVDPSPAGYATATTTGLFGWSGASVQCLRWPYPYPSTQDAVVSAVAYESDIMDRRQADMMKIEFPSTPGDPHPYLVNVLTLNLDRVQDFVQRCTSSTDPTWTGVPLRGLFNGLIYVHRTRRSDGYNPLLHPGWNPQNFTTAFGGFDPRVSGQSTVEMQANNRVSDGPGEIFHSAVRIAQGAAIDWGGRDVAAGNRRRGITVITPNLCYLWGNFNVLVDPAATTAPLPSGVTLPSLPALPNTNAATSPSYALDHRRVRAYIGNFLAGSDASNATYGYANYNASKGYTQLSNDQAQCLNFPPCAIFADGVTVLSSQWSDDGQVYASATSATALANQLTIAAETWFHYSNIVNNLPSDRINMAAEGSGGTHNVVRYLEDWTNVNYHTRGSLVVTNRMRFSRGRQGANSTPAYYQAPTRDLRFNTDLLSRAGQPPFAPFGVQVIRTVDTVSLLP